MTINTIIYYFWQCGTVFILHLLFEHSNSWSLSPITAAIFIFILLWKYICICVCINVSLILVNFSRRLYLSSLHWENYISISFQIEWDMVVVTVFRSILNQMKFHLVQNRQEYCHHDHIPFNVKGIGNIVFSVTVHPWDQSDTDSNESPVHISSKYMRSHHMRVS